MTTEAALPTHATVEAVVRAQMSAALGGRRGMFEAGVPGLIFAAVFLTTKDVPAALIGSLASATLMLSSTQMARCAELTACVSLTPRSCPTSSRRRPI